MIEAQDTTSESEAVSRDLPIGEWQEWLLSELLTRYGLVLTDDPDFDHDEETFAVAKAHFMTEVRAEAIDRHSRDARASSQAAGVEALVERIAVFVENWNGPTCDGDTVNIAYEIRDHFAALKAPAPSPEGVGEEGERPEIWPWSWRWPYGERVNKTKGSSWTGRVVGFYSTSLTPEGYAVESENEPGSVQIYPAAALQPTASTDTDDVRPAVEGKGNRANPA